MKAFIGFFIFLFGYYSNCGANACPDLNGKFVCEEDKVREISYSGVTYNILTTNTKTGESAHSQIVADGSGDSKWWFYSCSDNKLITHLKREDNLNADVRFYDFLDSSLNLVRNYEGKFLGEPVAGNSICTRLPM